MENFTPFMSTWGGLLIGLASALVFLFQGRVAGVSGILGGLLMPSGDAGWRAAYILGMVAAGAVGGFVAPAAFAMEVERSTLTLVVAGLLVGFGVRMGNGCTSGHGVCGISRLSPRSITATLTFMAVAIATVFVTEHVLGGQP